MGRTPPDCLPACRSCLPCHHGMGTAGGPCGQTVWGQEEVIEGSPFAPHGVWSSAVGAPPLLGKSNFRDECNHGSASSLKILLLPLGRHCPGPWAAQFPSFFTHLAASWGGMSVVPSSFLGSDGSRSLCSFLGHWLRTKGPGAAAARDEFLPVSFLCVSFCTQPLPLALPLHLPSQAASLVYELYLLWGFGFSTDL